MTVWLGSHSKKFGNGFNEYWHGRMLQQVRARNATAVYYAYIIAMLARHMEGIQDCDANVNTKSLCVYGADFVRNYEPQILNLYEHFANETARRLGSKAVVVWLMEPDWHQYSEHTQRGGGLKQRAMVALFQRMVQRVKLHLPHAQISIDISPWVNDQETWLRPFLDHCEIDYLHTSGGRTLAASRLVRGDPNNRVTWRELHRISGRGIIADTGYGVGGGKHSTADWQAFLARCLISGATEGLVRSTFRLQPVALGGQGLANRAWPHRSMPLGST